MTARNQPSRIAMLAELTLTGLHHNGCLGRDMHAATRDVSAECEIYRIPAEAGEIYAAAKIVVASPINQRKARYRAKYHSETSALHRNAVRAAQRAFA